MTAEAGRILVVDDVEMNRDLLARRLQQQGHTVSLAENGRRALERLRAEEFDLVLLDIMMPELDGYQVLGAMIGDAALKHVPVIMISAGTGRGSVVKWRRRSAPEYRPQPG